MREGGRRFFAVPNGNVFAGLYFTAPSSYSQNIKIFVLLSFPPLSY